MIKIKPIKLTDAGSCAACGENRNVYEVSFSALEGNISSVDLCGDCLNELCDIAHKKHIKRKMNLFEEILDDLSIENASDENGIPSREVEKVSAICHELIDDGIDINSDEFNYLAKYFYFKNMDW